MGRRAHRRAVAVRERQILNHALACALRAADAARQILLAECARPDGPRGEIGKCPADDEAELAIRSILRSEFPGWGFLGEETGLCAANSGEHHMWVVDPNDGTTSMQRGYRGHAVSIGLLRDGVPVLGVVWAVDAPDDRGDLISWAEGCGPILRNGVPVPPPDWPRQLSAEHVVGVSQGANRNPRGYAAAVAPARFVGLPSIAYRLALVAVGEHVATLSLNSLQEWDFAAGHALVRGAGGTLVDDSARPVRYAGTGAGPATRVFAGSPDVVRQLVRGHWDGVSRSGFGPAAPPTDFYPIRPNPGKLVHDSGILSRAHGCLLGQLAGDWSNDRPAPHAEAALLLARALVLDKPLPEFTLESAAPLGIAGKQDSVLVATVAAIIRIGLDVLAARAFAREWAARQGVTVPSALDAALSCLPNFDDPVSGALSGAIYGREYIPSGRVLEILSCRTPERTAEYWPTDALVIAERLLTSTTSTLEA